MLILLDMNTSVFKASDNLGVAESYYNAMLAKDFDKMVGLPA